MLNMRNTLLSTVLLGSAALAGCGMHSYYGYRVPPPSRPVYGMVGRAPGPGFVWTDGYYDLRGSRWVLVPGSWIRPPRHGAVWVSPYWEPHNRGYRFHRGYWR